MKKILLLTDYRDQFYFSTKYRGASVDIPRLAQYFLKHGYELIVKGFSEIDFRKDNPKNTWVLYQSSEDPDLRYKDYIEDILLGCRLAGAKLIPGFKYFRAHHNKVFMEILRDLADIVEIRNIRTKAYGTLEEFLKARPTFFDNPYVLKPSAGTRSRGVQLLNETKKQMRERVCKISRSFTLGNFKLWLSKLETGKSYVPMSNNRKKFLIQDYVSGLTGDYRVLAYGAKYYVAYRENRKDGFTASGSKKIHFEKELPPGLLDFARNVYTKLKVPYASFDIGHKDGVFYLFEFQCLCMGQYVLEKSEFYYTRKENGAWVKIIETPDLEREIAMNVINYMETPVCAEL